MGYEDRVEGMFAHKARVRPIGIMTNNASVDASGTYVA